METNKHPKPQRYTVRPIGMAAWSTTDSIEQAKQDTKIARDRNFARIVIYNNETQTVVDES